MWRVWSSMVRVSAISVTDTTFWTTMKTLLNIRLSLLLNSPFMMSIGATLDASEAGMTPARIPVSRQVSAYARMLPGMIMSRGSNRALAETDSESIVSLPSVGVSAAARAMARMKHRAVNVRDSRMYLKKMSFLPEPSSLRVAISTDLLPTSAY